MCKTGSGGITPVGIKKVGGEKDVQGTGWSWAGVIKSGNKTGASYSRKKRDTCKTIQGREKEGGSGGGKRGGGGVVTNKGGKRKGLGKNARKVGWVQPTQKRGGEKKKTIAEAAIRDRKKKAINKHQYIKGNRGRENKGRKLSVGKEWKGGERGKKRGQRMQRDWNTGESKKGNEVVEPCSLETKRNTAEGKQTTRKRTNQPFGGMGGERHLPNRKVGRRQTKEGEQKGALVAPPAKNGEKKKGGNLFCRGGGGMGGGAGF